MGNVFAKTAAPQPRQSLGELATLIPVTGSFTDYAGRFIDPALSFALGWAYWYLWVTVSRLWLLMLLLFD